MITSRMRIGVCHVNMYYRDVTSYVQGNFETPQPHVGQLRAPRALISSSLGFLVTYREMEIRGYGTVTV